MLPVKYSSKLSLKRFYWRITLMILISNSSKLLRGKFFRFLIKEYNLRKILKASMICSPKIRRLINTILILMKPSKNYLKFVLKGWTLASNIQIIKTNNKKNLSIWVKIWFPLKKVDNKSQFESDIIRNSKNKI